LVVGVRVIRFYLARKMPEKVARGNRFIKRGNIEASLLRANTLNEIAFVTQTDFERLESDKQFELASAIRLRLAVVG
jgi:hypothetical protein